MTPDEQLIQELEQLRADFWTPDRPMLAIIYLTRAIRISLPLTEPERQTVKRTIQRIRARLEPQPNTAAPTNPPPAPKAPPGKAPA